MIGDNGGELRRIKVACSNPVGKLIVPDAVMPYITFIN